MTNDGNLLLKYLSLQKALLSSLRLKDVLDAAVMQFVELAGGAKVAVFLSDNETLSLKLMAAKGYGETTLEQLKVLPFSADSILKYVVQKRQAVTVQDIDTAPDLSASVMRREASSGQIALPLISVDLLVGCVLLDVTSPDAFSSVDLLESVAEITAAAIANSILFGRSEYERERLNTLYKTSCALNTFALEMSEVLQIASDTALILGNTPHCAILLLDPESSTFRLAAFKGLEGSSLSEFDLNEQDTVAGACLRSGKTEYIGDGGREPFGLPRASGGAPFASVLALPLINGDKPLGVIEVFSTEARAFHREQIELLESLSGQVTNALHVAITHQVASAHTAYDVHTGLYNRLHFEDALVKEIERSARHHHEVGLLLIDIDHLVQINEHLGQDKGDEAIKHVAKLLKSVLRDIDIPCRYGGNEFAVILPETQQASTVEVAERVRQSVRQAPAPGIGTITVSIGAAGFPANADAAENLLKASEQALDVAKYEGRDRVKEAQSGNYVAAGPIDWDELARQAKLAVINQRQLSMHSRLTVAPEYAGWLTKQPGLVRKKLSESKKAD